MNRLSKQIIYGFIFIALITGAVLLGAYLIKLAGNQPPPYIDINPNNQSQEIQITNFQGIKSSKNSLLSDYIIELYNPRDNQGAKKISYTMGDTKDKSYLLPLEKKIVIITGEQKNLTEDDFIVNETLWVDFPKQESAELLVQEKKYLAEDKEINGSSVSASIYNKSKYDLAVVDADIIIYDLQESPIAVLHSQINKLFSGQEQSFKVFWPYFINKNAGEVFIQVSSNIMDTDNTKIYSSSETERFQSFQ